jgi:hypothetical protein
MAMMVLASFGASAQINCRFVPIKSLLIKGKEDAFIQRLYQDYAEIPQLKKSDARKIIKQYKRVYWDVKSEIEICDDVFYMFTPTGGGDERYHAYEKSKYSDLIRFPKKISKL